MSNIDSVHFLIFLLIVKVFFFQTMSKYYVYICINNKLEYILHIAAV